MVLLTSRTERKLISVIKSCRLWYFIRATLTNEYTYQFSWNWWETGCKSFGVFLFFPCKRKYDWNVFLYTQSCQYNKEAGGEILKSILFSVKSSEAILSVSPLNIFFFLSLFLFLFFLNFIHSLTFNTPPLGLCEGIFHNHCRI